MSLTTSAKKDLRRATLLVVASIALAVLFALFPKDTNTNNKKISYLEKLDKKSSVTAPQVQKRNRDDIKVIELEDFGSVKAKN